METLADSHNFKVEVEVLRAGHEDHGIRPTNYQFTLLLSYDSYRLVGSNFP